MVKAGEMYAGVFEVAPLSVIVEVKTSWASHG